MRATRTTFNRWALLIGIAPAVLFFLVMGFGPSIATFIISFTNISGVSGVPWHFIGLENYKEFFFQQSHRDLIQVVKNTILFCIAVTIIQNAIALPVAMVLNNTLISGRSFFRAVVFLPVVLGVLVTSLVWMAVLNPMDGPVTKLIGVFGLTSPFFTGGTSIALWCVIFTQIWMYLGYSMVINLAGLQSIPTELYEAGEMDGANKSQVFRNITFPLLWPTINVNLLLAVIGSLQSFQIILIATTGRNMATQTLAARSVFYAFAINAGSGAPAMRQGYGATWSIVLFVFILTATLIYQRAMKRRNLDT